jgi:predicted AAA+ superfamily ATPase
MNQVYSNSKTIFLDEIQNLKNWELFVNRLQRQGYTIVLTGSNSHLLSSELSTHLTGRHLQIVVLPFSFKEYIQYYGNNLTSSEIKSKFDEYAIYGGFPEPLIKKISYKEYLSTLLNSIFYKDISKRYNIRRPQAISDIADQLLANISNEHSINSIRKISKIKSVQTVEKYLGYLEESFIFFSLKRFSYKVKEHFAIRKIFCIDNGFIHAKAFQTGANIGKLYENIVAIKLKKEELQNKISLYYWKNNQQEEVDFVIKKDAKIISLIQVSYDTHNTKTHDREVRALLKAGKELNCSKLIIITKDKEGIEREEWFGNKGEITYIPIWKWLLLDEDFVHY